ncbi:helix-turn-helix domain-containing protein [Hafnia psychrotolerans]|uniref:Uncharacterized protein n=1 Tax=Hafnia psychrotolerans TaxID=1477018 RepID=A0ABQ1G8B4_9GAMM|nr:helix-turn-helix domain-containing protein [Hafnia psychrotolerans]GGA38547.1 hypothetical protein GCM10011328_11740 [Hafnia psychrotolerans]
MMRTNSYSAAMFMSWVLSQGILTCPFPNVHPLNAREFSNCYNMLKDFPLLATELKRMAMYSREWRAVVQNWEEWTELMINGRLAKLSELMTVTFIQLSMPALSAQIDLTTCIAGPKRRNIRGGHGSFHLSDEDRAFIQKSRGRLSLKRIAAVLDRPYPTIMRNAKLL